jgi:hypothetical protein
VPAKRLLDVLAFCVHSSLAAMTDSFTLYVISPAITPRLTYTVSLLFEELLQQPAKAIPEDERRTLPADAWVLNYTDQPMPEGLLHIPPEGLLTETHIRDEPPALAWVEGFPRLFPLERLDSLGFDILSAAFYLASGYAFYQTEAKDEHGRYDEQALFPVQQELHKHPWVHHYAEHLARHLAAATGHRPRLPVADYQLTWDIDRPWAYRHQGLLRQLRGSLGDIRHSGITTMLERWQTLAGFRLDPFYTYALIRQYSAPAKTTCFFLINGRTRYDSLYSAQHKGYQKLILDLREEGFSIGLHPSYQTMLKPALLHQEKAQLEAILQQPVTQSRQHFLRYQFPDTFRTLAAAGIQQDASLCPVTTTGFLIGMARPFLWFDLTENQPSSLTLHPTMAMDRSLQQYQCLTPEAAVDELHRLQERSRGAGGVFTALLHNETLSNRHEWAGWQAPLLSWLSQLP